MQPSKRYRVEVTGRGDLVTEPSRELFVADREISGKEAARDNLDREAAQAAIGLTYFAVRLRRKAMTSLRSPWAST